MQEKDVFLSMKAEIEHTAQKQVDAINAEVKKMEDEALQSMQEEAKKDADLKLKQELEEIHSEASAEISETHTQRTKKLIAKRDEYVAEVFKAAREKLVAFTNSAEYKDYLLKKAKAAADNDFVDAVMLVRAEDMQYSEELKKAYGKTVEVKASDEITLGGFILENTADALVVNETLEFALENQKTWFANNSGLMIK
ncbi:V-type ATP synthase subunit E [Intestinibaculum porci]|uniref:V-type ATP synthase subunit E n=1 Tax=Intestinibaculum porci TaxID=2487118 RepID=UPI00240A1E0A|nr:V-type ATP synthase subunit E [Intestinibaculum porci]MDD6348519.1 V-type ATP synthase subunit E [Intestinibaculum porci]MDD6423071.1 V-type ATP synthase subunit E [Intestinibaculum porci]